jgi:hypothetical protein
MINYSTFSRLISRKMGRHSIITKGELLSSIRLLRLVTRFILLLFFGGGERRIKALERLLPVLEKEGLITAQWHRGEKVYSVTRKRKGRPVSIDHEIACALILVLLWRCRMAEGEIVPERAFRGFGIVPEAGIRFSEERKTMLLIEFETRKDYKRAMKGKITRYLKYLPAMEKKFKRSISVLFVIDVERREVLDFIKRMNRMFGSAQVLDFDGSEDGSVGSAGGEYAASSDGDRFPLDPFFFTDYQTFKSVPVGHALNSKIYYWHDGTEWNEWRLSNHD